MQLVRSVRRVESRAGLGTVSLMEVRRALNSVVMVVRSVFV